MKSTHTICTLMHYTCSLVLDYSKEYVLCTYVVSIHKFEALGLPLCMMTNIYPYTYVYCASCVHASIMILYCVLRKSETRLIEVV